MKREVSREGSEYLKTLRTNRTPFGTNDFDLKALRAGMGSRRKPTIKDVNANAVQPYLKGSISQQVALDRGAAL